MAVSDLIPIVKGIKAGVQLIKAGAKSLLGSVKDDAARAACKMVCGPGSACFTAGHQVLRVVGEADHANASGVVLASDGSGDTTNLDEETKRRDRLTLVAALFVVAAGVAAYQGWPRLRRRRPSATHAVDAVLADDDMLHLSHLQVADDIDDAWEGEELELKAGRRLSRV